MATTLDQLIEDARRHDSQYRAALALYRAAEGRADQAFAKLLPAFNATANAFTNSQRIEYSDRANPQQQANFETYGYNFQVIQPLYRPINRTEDRQAKVQLRQARFQVGQAELELAKRVSQSFFEACQARDALFAAEAQIASASSKHEATNLQLKKGTATIADHLNSSFKLDLARSEALEARTDLESKLFALKQLTGRELSAEGLDYRDIPLPIDPQPLEKWLMRAVQCNPAVLAQQEARDLARLELEKASGGHHPTLDLVANHGLNKQGPSASLAVSTVVRTTSVGVQLSVPLYAGGGISARERETAAMLEKADEDLETALRQAALEVQQAHAGLRSGLGQVDAVKTAIAASSESLRALQLGEELGTRSRPEVMAIQQQLAEARREMTKAHAKALFSSIRLRAAVGDLTNSVEKSCATRLLE